MSHIRGRADGQRHETGRRPSAVTGRRRRALRGALRWSNTEESTLRRVWSSSVSFKLVSKWLRFFPRTVALAPSISACPGLIPEHASTRTTILRGACVALASAGWLGRSERRPSSAHCARTKGSHSGGQRDPSVRVCVNALPSLPIFEVCLLISRMNRGGGGTD